MAITISQAFFTAGALADGAMRPADDANNAVKCPTPTPAPTPTPTPTPAPTPTPTPKPCPDNACKCFILAVLFVVVFFVGLIIGKLMCAPCPPKKHKGCRKEHDD